MKFTYLITCCSVIIFQPQNLYAENCTITHKIKSETVVTSPSDKARKKLGIGEEVTLTFLGGHNATWTLTGKGKIDGGTAPVPGKTSVKYTAPEASTPTSPKAIPDKITAQCDEGGGHDDIEFTVVAPTGVTMKERTPASETGDVPLAVGMKADVWITPADVNFEKIKIKEDGCTPIAKDYFDYQSTVNHDPTNDWIAMSGHEQGKGTKLENPDLISGGTKGPPYSAGTFTWNIPWRYNINSADKGIFKIVPTVKTLSVDESSATLTWEKADAKIQHTTTYLGN